MKVFQTIFQLLFSILIPIYLTFDSINSQDIYRIHSWILYWCCMSLVLFIENCFRSFLKHIPLMDVFSLIIRLWLMSPFFNLSIFLFNNIFEPLISKSSSSSDYSIVFKQVICHLNNTYNSILESTE